MTTVMTTVEITVADASTHTSFRRTFLRGTLKLHYGDKDCDGKKDCCGDKDIHDGKKDCDGKKDILAVSMYLEWEGLKFFGSAPAIECEFQVGDRVHVYTGKCLAHSQMEDVGGIIERFELSGEELFAVIGSVRHFVFDLRGFATP